MPDDSSALQISARVSIPLGEIELTAIRAQGAGGQNVNKVSTAIHLQFDIHRSSLPDFYKQRLLSKSDSRISKQGVITIKAQTQRSQERNREDALQRLTELVQGVARTKKKRIATRPTKGSQKRRLESKNKQGKLKQQRKKVDY